MHLDELEPVLLGEEHEAVHGPLGFVGVLLLLRRLGRAHRRRHHRLARRARSRHRRQPLRRLLLSSAVGVVIGGGGYRDSAGFGRGELEAAEAVAEVGRADGLGVVGREADVADGQFVAGDAVALHGEPGLGRGPSCRENERGKG